MKKRIWSLGRSARLMLECMILGKRPYSKHRDAWGSANSANAMVEWIEKLLSEPFKEDTRRAIKSELIIIGPIIALYDLDPQLTEFAIFGITVKSATNLFWIPLMVLPLLVINSMNLGYCFVRDLQKLGEYRRVIKSIRDTAIRRYTGSGREFIRYRKDNSSVTRVDPTRLPKNVKTMFISIERETNKRLFTMLLFFIYVILITTTVIVSMSVAFVILLGWIFHV